jgi:hypothetical protein
LNTVVALLLSAECSGQEISFRKQVQPLLANRCLACHGPDENSRKADLRLDTEAGAKEFAIEPGNADGSELLARIEADDPDIVMPPTGHGEPLSSAEQKLLRDWINQGAPWQHHWAFEPIKRPSVPADNSGWSQGEVDRFVLQRIKEAGLETSEKADDRTLLRRVYLDLIGLPPTPDQVQQFLADTSADRFEKVVDQLLRSKHYGEQMAAAWLDIARFADTNGYQNDFVRSMWVWRDWVIDAYNSNMPYDQFIIQQIAGDMLPDPTTSQLIASGFNRNNPTVTEGGSIDEEWRIENCVDRTETTAAAFLGLTMGCARCHDHKYDPVSQNEFFEFFAFFNNIDEQGVYTEARGNVGPVIKTPTPAQVAALSHIDEQIEALDRKTSDNDHHDAKSLLQELRTSTESVPLSIPQPSWSIDDTGVKDFDWSPAGKALSFEAKEQTLSLVDSHGMTFERDQPFSWTSWVHGNARGAIFGKMDEAQGYRGVDTLILDDGRLKVHLISAWNSNAIAVLSKDALPSKWNHLAVTYAGNSKAAGFKIYVDGKPVAMTTEVDNLTDSTVIEVPLRIGQRSQSSHLRGMISKFSLYASDLTDEQIALAIKQDLIEHLDRVANSDLDSTAGDAALAYLRFSSEHYAAKAKLLEQRKQLIASQQTTMVMRERGGEYRPTWRLDRGQYDQPDKSVDLWPGVPKALPQLADDQPRNRLGLARWLVDQRNPLVARVIVNRAWMKFFGRGLVDPPDNFGVQGAPPSHPELLDWLADDFRSQGWDLKRLHRQIVLSATYQQASESTPEKLELDRENLWISRGPRYRMSAEQIRDSALLMSGLLGKKIGGPSVFPYQPDGLWEELAGGANNGPYKQSSGDDLYRRSLYTYRKRTVPHPTTSTFDAPSWEKCQIKRANTNTPLQALALLNDTTYVEAAKKFAERILSEGGETLDDRIDFAVLVAMSRAPTAIEKTTLEDGFQYYLQFYQTNADEAKRLLAIGESSTEPLDPAELAAMASVASIILNLDTTVTKE